MRLPRFKEWPLVPPQRRAMTGEILRYTQDDRKKTSLYAPLLLSTFNFSLSTFEIVYNLSYSLFEFDGWLITEFV